MKVFPMSIMTALGQRIQFSGGGYLRLFNMPIVHYGFRQNHRAGRPVMTYIHPREVNPQQPRLQLPRHEKLQVLREHGYDRRQAARDAEELSFRHRGRRARDTSRHYDEYEMVDGDIVPMREGVPHSSANLAAGR